MDSPLSISVSARPPISLSEPWLELLPRAGIGNISAIWMFQFNFHIFLCGGDQCHWQGLSGARRSAISPINVDPAGDLYAVSPRLSKHGRRLARVNLWGAISEFHFVSVLFNFRFPVFSFGLCFPLFIFIWYLHLLLPRAVVLALHSYSYLAPIRHRVIGTFRVVVLFFPLFFHFALRRRKIRNDTFLWVFFLFFNYPVRLLICGFNARVVQIGKGVWITRIWLRPGGKGWHIRRQGPKMAARLARILGTGNGPTDM